MISTFVYTQYLTSKAPFNKMWAGIRAALIVLLKDPICELPINGIKLKLALSHQLPKYLVKYPHYDKLPIRLSHFIHEKNIGFNCIDIGANIGDTIALLYKNPDDFIIAVEPNPKFNTLLTQNWCANQNIIILDILCSSVDGDSNFIISEKNGTASVIQANDGLKLISKTVDTLWKQYFSNKKINLLKIDTDGHDLHILMGAKEMLLSDKPVILFECAMFDNDNYAVDCLAVFEQLKYCGYHYFLAYDNFGYLMGKYSLSEPQAFMNLIFYQLTSEFHYFDLVVMSDDDINSYYGNEIEYYLSFINEQTTKNSAHLAAMG